MVVSNILEFILFIETMKEVSVEILAFGKNIFILHYVSHNFCEK